MEFIPMIVIAALTFGVCFLVDRGFRKIFRGKVQHISGLSVRLNKRYATIGIILTVLGISAIFVGLGGTLILLVGGPIVVLMGVGLIVYYMTFGVFYDSDGFVLTTFGKRSTTYRYNQIAGQLLYNASGNVLFELHMKDGRSVNLQATMPGAYAFLDYAFEKWCYQTGKKSEDCDFHDPDNSLWFPLMEG
jgi:hypothetical protein